jgi:metal-responsive CopG/Arc/MetJ family transcriptional regulator
MTRTNKIAISLPDEVLQKVEKERAESGESRSQYFRRAVESLLSSRKAQERSRIYIRAYQEMPETTEEINTARLSARAILGEEPWQ